MEQQEEVDMIQEDDKRALDKENEKDAVDGENAAMDEDFKGEVRVVSKIKGDPFQGSEEEDARGVTSEEEPAQQIAIPEQHAPMDVNEKKLEAGAVTRPTNITVDGARNLKVGFVAPEQQTITRLEYDTFLEKHLKVCVENEMLRAALEKKQARSEISYYNISFCSVM